MPQDMEQQTLNVVQLKEQETQRVRIHIDAQPEPLKEQWKRQVSQAATYKAEIHALHTELRNVQKASELNSGQISKSLPQFILPSTHRTPSILDMRQLLEDWLNKVTFAIVTWRGDAPEISVVSGCGDTLDQVRLSTQGFNATRGLRMHLCNYAS